MAVLLLLDVKTATLRVFLAALPYPLYQQKKIPLDWLAQLLQWEFETSEQHLKVHKAESVEVSTRIAQMSPEQLQSGWFWPFLLLLEVPKSEKGIQKRNALH